MTKKHDRNWKVVWFGTRLVQSGGGERLSLEVVHALRNQGYDAHYLVYHYDRDKTFEGRYDFLNILRFEDGYDRSQFISPVQGRIWGWRRRFWLRRMLKELRPDVVITTGTWSQVVELHLATLGMSLTYGVHVFGSLFAFGPDVERTKYACIFRDSFEKIRSSVASYQNTVPALPPPMSLREQLSLEILARLKRRAIRRAKAVWVLSDRNRMETEYLYGIRAEVLKGAFPEKIFAHRPAISLRDELGLEDKRIVLSICRLVPNKRVDLCVLAFIEFARTRDDVDLVIGGTGDEEGRLRQLVEEAGLKERVHFIGYVPESRLLDYYADCDIAVHLDLADFDIAPLEALAVGARVIWADEMDLPEIIKHPGFVYEVPSDPRYIASVMAKALSDEAARPSSDQRREVLRELCWEKFAGRMMSAFHD